MKEFFYIPIFTLAIASCGGLTVSKPTGNASVSNNSNASNSNRTVTAAKVTIDSPDGVKLIGTYLPAPKPDSPAVLLFHQWQSDRHSYDEFAKRMHEKGFAVLSIDGRGFGESTKSADASAVTAGRTDADVKDMLGDVDAAFNYLSKQPNVDASKIGIVGASYGSSLALIYAAEHPNVAAVALLSPGLNYFGNMPTRPAVEKYGQRDLFIVVAKGDEESAKAVDGLTIGQPKHGFMVLPTGTFHGTEMFKYRDKTGGPPVVEDALESFLMTRLGLADGGHK